MNGNKERGPKQDSNNCGKCELFSATSESHGCCEFWKSMDVMPMWMEGERVPTHAVKHNDGERCEAFIPVNDTSGARHNWMLDNLTSMN